MVKIVLWIIGIPAGLFLVLVVYEAFQPTVPITERIKNECQQSFGPDGDDAVLRCRTALSLQYLKDRQNEKLRSAYDHIR